MNYATKEDLTELWRTMTPSEEARAEQYLTIVSDELREAAYKHRRDLDQMIDERPSLASIAKSVVCDVVARVLQTSTDNEPMTQITQSANGYSLSGTYLNPGGGVFIKKSELARLGIRRQRIGSIEYEYGGNRD